MLGAMSRTSELTAWTLMRTAGIDMNPTLVTQRANQFATKTSGFASTTLLIRREDDTMRGYLVTSGVGADSLRAATDLAHTVGAKAVSTEPPTDLDLDNVVGWLVFESGSVVARDPQVNADPAETARLLANTLPPGSWVAVSMRRPSQRERARNHAWLSHRLSTAVPNHHSLSPDAVVVSIYAGGPDARSVSALLESARSAMPGFDVITKAKVATRLTTILGPGLVGAAAIAAGVGSTFTSAVPSYAGPALLVPGLALGAAAILVGVLRFVGVLPSAWRRTQAMARECRFAPPRKRLGRPKPPRKEINRADKYREARDGDYPLHPSTFQVGAQVVVGIVAPQAGAVSGESETKARDVPPVMLRQIGPLIGDSDQGPAFLSADDAFGGVAVVGKAGSGKSVLVRSMFGWACLDRRAEANMSASQRAARREQYPGFPGATNALIAFESKGDGVAQYQAWADATGDVMVAIDLADPSSYAIDIFAIPGSVFEKAEFFVNALIYAFSESAIGDRSRETLLSVIPAALLVTPQIAALVEGIDPNASPLYYTHVLLGGRGEAPARALYNELKAAAHQPDADPMLREAVVGMSQIYGEKVTDAARRQLVEAPRNKLRQLLGMESWWTPTRRKVTWTQILDGHRAVVINTGSSMNGTMVEEMLSGQMSAVLMYSLRHAIQRTCSGWQDEGRSVSIFADELSLLAGSSEQVVAWLKDQGRSFGVRPFLATQRPEQLPDRVRSAFMNFSTLVSYMQEDMGTANEIANGVSSEEGEWTSSDILGLNTYTAVVRAHVAKKRQPAFTVKVRNFEYDRYGFAAQQGYFADGVPAGPAATPLVEEVDPASNGLVVSAPVAAPVPTAIPVQPVLAHPAIPARVVTPPAHDQEPDVDDAGLMKW